MEITINWQKPIQLTQNKQLVVDPNALPLEIERNAGVFFARWFGENSEPFYIGQSLNLRMRLKQHLNTVKIYKALCGINGGVVDIGIGPRYFHYGYFKAKPGQQAKTCLEIVERRMIREAVEKGLIILNEHGIKIKTHSVFFDGSPERRSVFAKIAEVEA